MSGLLAHCFYVGVPIAAIARAWLVDLPVTATSAAPPPVPPDPVSIQRDPRQARTSGGFSSPLGLRSTLIEPFPNTAVVRARTRVLFRVRVGAILALRDCTCRIRVRGFATGRSGP